MMKEIVESPRVVPVMAETDVVVVGSGPAGLSAALASAREGVDTLLVERHGCFGGNITQSMVGTIAWYRSERTVDAGGIGVEFECRALEMGAALDDPDGQGQLLDADMFKVVADRLVQAAGVVPVLHCQGVDAIMDGDTLEGVITESKSGRQAILARCVIDATGDADLAFRAGAPYSVLPKEQRMPVSTTFGCSGVDVPEFLAYIHKNPSRLSDWANKTAGKEDDLFSTWIVEPFNRAKEAGEMPADATVAGYWGGLTAAGEATNINVAQCLGVDTTDVWDLTRAEMEGREKAMWALEALKKYAPGFQEARLRSFNSSLGTRESRRIVGEYVLTERDVKSEARFDDTIGIFPEFLDAYSEVIMPTTGRYFQVPYGVVVPRQVENLLVAGRPVSAEKVASSATRQMMCCTVTGQGAGVAAAAAVKQGVSPRRVSLPQVQKALEKQGVRIG